MAKILVVDDEKHVRAVLVRAVMLGGHEPLEAEDGTEALLAYENEKPDLIITDIIMPKMDGFELIRELSNRFSSAKIIAISGGSKAMHKRRDDEVGSLLESAKEFGAHKTFSKPFELDDILTAIDEMLSLAN